MDRRDFMVGGLALVFARAEAGDEPRLSPDDVSALREEAQAIQDTAARYGGEAAWPHAHAVASGAHRLLGAPLTGVTREELHLAIGWVMTVTGAIAHDVGREDAARYYWSVGSDCGQLGGSWSLRARILGYKARQAVALGHPGSAVAYATEAAHSGPVDAVLSPSEHALALALLAQAEAAAGDRQAAMRAAGEADVAFSHRGLLDFADRPWLAHWSQASHQSEVAEAMATLALVDEEPATVARATGLAHAAVKALGPAAAGTRAMTMARLAEVDLRVGDPMAGLMHGHEAVDAADAVASPRVRRQVTALSSAARGVSHLPGAADLVERCEAVGA